MKKETYIRKRNELVEKAQSLIDAGNIGEEYNNIISEIESLDTQQENENRALANLEVIRGGGRMVINPMADNTQVDTVFDVSSVISRDDQYANAFAKAIHGDKLTDKENEIIADYNRDYRNSETAKEHALVIPETLMSGIWQKAAEQHPILADVTPTYIKGDVKFLVDTSADSDADWVDEATASTDATFSEGNIILSGCELCKSVSLSWKLKKMSVEDYIPYIIDKLGQKIGNAIAKAIVSGKGKPTGSDDFKPQAKGIITKLKEEASTPNIVTYTAGKMSYKDLTALMAKLKGAYKAGAAIYANSHTVWSDLYNVVDTTGHPIFVKDANSGGVGYIFGVPVKEEDAIADNDILLGNVNEGYRFNFNESMTIYQEEHVKPRETDYMAYAIADGDVLSTEPFALLTTVASE